MSTADTFPARYGPSALVAGAAVGLGAEYARQLAARGLGLVLIDRDAGPLESTAAAIRAAHSVEVRTLALDLVRPDVADAVVAATADVEIGLLVYNAAISVISPYVGMSPADVQAMIDVNCRAPLLLVHALVPAMAARGHGGVILMSSMAGSRGAAHLSVYSATKAFALVFADALWAELRGKGVDVLAVQPGQTRTPGWQASQPPELRGPGPHVMEPAEVVAEALATLGVEPTLVPGDMNRQSAELLASLPRRQAIELMSAITVHLVATGRAS